MTMTFRFFKLFVMYFPVEIKETILKVQIGHAHVAYNLEYMYRST